MDLDAAVAALLAEARATDQRRLLVCHGNESACRDAVATITRTARESTTHDDARGTGSHDDTGAHDDVGEPDTVDIAAITDADGGPHGVARYEPHAADDLLGTTRDVIVVDGFSGVEPNTIGQTVGAVAGGGLYVVVLPPPEEWVDAVDDLRERLTVPPFAETDVGGAFRERLLATVDDHPGVAVYDADGDRLLRDGLTGETTEPPRSSGTLPQTAAFPTAAYEACLTADQGSTLRRLERLRESGEVVVVEADRGRGKSSVAGLAAGSLAAAGADVVVTAPSVANAGPLFERAAELLDTLGRERAGASADGRAGVESTTPDPIEGIESDAGGSVRYVAPPALAETISETGPDAVIVDEAAALPVARLVETLAAPAVAFVTTVHGYEGAGRGFAVRFRDRLADADHDVTETHLREPIRYAPDDPLESWAFRTLVLDARPAADSLVADANPETATYHRLDTAALRRDEHLLREVFGLLVRAHYRTEPTDLARLLDAPNLSVHALTVGGSGGDGGSVGGQRRHPGGVTGGSEGGERHDRGHVVSVALVAREGGLSAARRDAIFRGERIRGNMLPDLLTGQLRDPDAGAPVGYRVMRIATHEAARRSGFGSRLLAELRADLADGLDDRPGFPPADYLGTGFGATPGVVDFWRTNGYRTVHLSTTRNDTSGEHSAVLLRPVSEAGRALTRRHADGFRDRIGSVLADGLSNVDPDVVRATLRACDADPAPLAELTDYEWRIVVGAATGPGLYGTDPRPFRRLAVAALLGGPRRRGAADGSDDTGETASPLSAREERLLVRKVLQARPWDDVAAALEYVSTGECMRALGEAYVAVVDALGGETARRERERYE
ncbi:GNAT family N-acetyltransferase [Halobaculum sp. MBLA0147]|uniref:GNAT family N-acetyltransferase n=1 Tax=Halobaculum sp. MBLA0147 TaxID=3079934 RepID=UPI00352313E9